MYAVIETGGKQYRVAQGDILDVERISGVSEDEPEVTFDRVLLTGDDDEVQVGTPVVDGVTVKARLVSEVRGPKITVFKMKRRKQYRRKTGHRQNLHRIRIEGIEA